MAEPLAADAVPKGRLVPTRRALAVACTAVALALLPVVPGAAALWPLWLIGCGLLLAALAVDALFCPAARRLAAEVELPELLLMDERGEGIVRLRHTGPGAVGRGLGGLRPGGLRGELLAELSATLQPVPAVPFRLSAEAAGGGWRAEVTLPLTPRRRGSGRLAALWLRYTGPLGLMERSLRRPLRAAVRIVPNVRFVGRSALAFFGAREARAGQKIERFVGDGSEIYSLREFVSGHDPRNIDWKASARHTRLLARERRAERNHHIVLALDTGRLMAEPVARAAGQSPVPLLDHAIHAALLLAYVSLRHGDRVSLYSFAERPGSLSPPRGGVGAMAHLLALSGDLEYSLEEPNFTLGLTELTSRLRRRCLVVVLTDFVDTVTAELMVENLLRLNRRHLVLFVALRDPALARLATAEPRALADLDRAVVAASMLREREVVLRRLAKAGLTAVDAAPGQIGPELLNRYLAIKRREMI